MPLALALGLPAGLLALGRDVPAAVALAAAGSAGAFWVFLLRRPGAWIPLFLSLALLLPPFPVAVGEEEWPVHPASLLFALALPAALPRLRARDPLSAIFAAFLATTLFSVGLGFFYSGAALGAQSLLRWLLLSQAFVIFFWMADGSVPAPAQGAGRNPASEALVWPGQGLDESRLVRLLLILTLLGAVFAVVDFLYQFPPTVRFSEQYIYLAGGPLRRAQGVFYDASALGNFCAMMLTLILAIGLGGRTRPNDPGQEPWRVPARAPALGLQVGRLLLWLPVPALAVALVLSFSRGAMLNLAAALAVLAWLRRRQLLSWRAALMALGAGSAAALAVALLIPEVALRFAMRLQYTASQVFAYPNEVLSMRLEAWRFLLNFVVEHPQHFLLGIGYKTLPYTQFFGRPLVADNMYLSLLVETGVVGLTVFLLLCLVLLLRTYRMSRAGDPVLAILGGFLFAAWCGEMVQMLSGDTLTYWRVTPVYFVLLGAAARRERRPAA